MKIKKIGEPNIIMSNPESKHPYFAWPTAVRLQNGKIAVGASGFRLSHVCPFGKSVISYSEDEGKTYSLPAPVIDTVLDDRDVGIATFGEKGVIFTSFNNTVTFQRQYLAKKELKDNYHLAYLDQITPEEEARYLGSTFRISHDYGVTFGKIYISPITSPHGPIELHDGTVLWVGRPFFADDNYDLHQDCIQAYTLHTETGAMEYVGQIDPIYYEGELLLSCEPHAIQLPNGTILCHIRAQRRRTLSKSSSPNPIFTTYQSVSADGGKTWSKPQRLLDIAGGAPSHLLLHSSGTLIAAYGRRELPYGIRLIFSRDGGKTWDTEHILYETTISDDLGYPATVELQDGSLITVFYARLTPQGPAVIFQQKWTLEE